MHVTWSYMSRPAPSPRVFPIQKAPAPHSRGGLVDPPCRRRMRPLALEGTAQGGVGRAASVPPDALSVLAVGGGPPPLLHLPPRGVRCHVGQSGAGEG
eukprot:scaffold1628_cov407-Prasinococcus_capsulatus_cf.AAC.2